MKHLFAILLAAIAFSMVTGCKHTAHGVGEDMEEAGEKIQKKTN